MKTPCSNCPFTSSMHLRNERTEEIHDALVNGGYFDCHKTLTDKQPKICTGSVIYTDHILGNWAKNQAYRMAARLGIIDPDQIDFDYPVAKSLEDFQDLQN